MNFSTTKMGKRSGLRFYSPVEYVKRGAWALVQPSFKYSPRLLYPWRNFMLRCFGARVARGVKVYPSVRIQNPWNLDIGKDTVIGWNTTLYALGTIRIGEECVISQGSHLCAGSHDYEVRGFPLLKVPIEVGNRCWVAAEAFIGPGVTLADQVIVGARAVVTKPQPPGAVVVGNPARIVRMRDGGITSAADPSSSVRDASDGRP